MKELSNVSLYSTEYINFITFIKDLRTDARTLPGFIEQITSISLESQVKYMDSNRDCFFVALYCGIPVGFGGVVNNDIRFAVIPYYQNLGFGTEILEYIKLRNPKATGKIKRSNASSIKAFCKVGIEYTIIE